MYGTRAARFLGSFIIALLLAPSPLRAQTGGGALFITSTPYGAEVLLNGTAQEKRTPILLRDIAPGEYTVSVTKPGYAGRVGSIVVPADKAEHMDLTLTPLAIGMIAPENHRVYHPDAPEGEDSRYLAIPSGSYHFQLDTGTLRIDPVYPRQSMIDGLGFALPLLLLVTAALTVGEMRSPRDSDLPVSPEMLSAGVFSAGLLTLDIALHADRRAYRRTAVRKPLTPPPGTDSELLLFSLAERTLEQGNLENAFQLFRQLVEQHPEARGTPRALYQMAQIRLGLGAYREAEALLLRVVGDYPTPEVYDRARKSLSDINVMEDKPEEAVRQIDAMVFFDPAFPRELMSERRGLIQH